MDAFHNINKKIIDVLKYMLVYKELTNANKYSIDSYKKAIDVIERSIDKINNGYQAKTMFPGVVGDKISNNIDNILQNNNISLTGINELDSLPSNLQHQIVTISNLMSIQGIGFIKAKDYYNKGIYSLEQLKNSGLMTERQRIGNKYSEEFKKRIPREKITKYGMLFRQKLDDFNRINNSTLNFNILGSYMREQPTSGDIDILMWANRINELSFYFQNFLNTLRNNRMILETLSIGNDSFQGVAYIDDEYPSVRIDIKMINDNTEYYYALLYYTGSGKFNEHMREIAKSKGYTLGNNEMTYQVQNSKQRVIVNSEKEIFDVLGMTYLLPNQRN